MNHPKPEEWIPYLFGEATPAAHQQLSHHLQNCAECSAELETWKRSLRRLDAWRLPKRQQPSTNVFPTLRWAFGTALILLVGFVFLVGRLTANSSDETRLRESIAAQVRQEIRAEFNQQLREQLAASAAATLKVSGEQAKSLLVDYDRTVRARLENESAQRITDCLSLKKDVDTIAVNADAGLRNTEQRLAQLAVYRPPIRVPAPPTKESSN
jgi:hypothetical protein